MLTTLDPVYNIVAFTIDVPGRGTFPAQLQHFDPRTGAALLKIDAVDLVTAPSETSAVTPRQRVLVLSRNEMDGSFGAKRALASPSLNAPDHLFALLRTTNPYHDRSSVVITQDGSPVGLAGGRRAWPGFGDIFISGPAGGPHQPAILLSSARQLLDGTPSDFDSIPSAVAYGGLGRWAPIDGPVTRKMVAEPLQEVFNRLGDPVAVEGIGRSTYWVFRSNPGTALELIYDQPQELRSVDGELLGSARYIALWWFRGGYDLLLCGTEPDRLGAAFVVTDLVSLEPLLEQVPWSTRSIVRAAPMR